MQTENQGRNDLVEVTPVTFTLTESDVVKYRTQIDNFPLEKQQKILSELHGKLKKLLEKEDISTFVLQLVQDVDRMFTVLVSNPDLDIKSRKMILFALSYFIEEKDEIPDEIDILGFLDDAVIVRWVMDELLKLHPEFSSS
ncbi:MAG: YkvA family protein [Fidelibacterota bacterium]